MKKRIVVICPGRGSYTKETLGYLTKSPHDGRSARAGDPALGRFVADIDQRRAALGEPTITELDRADVFKTNVHTKGEHASALIYACAYADFLAINRERYEVVAVTGNSMGWYLALAYGGALDWAGGFAVVNTMGSMMKDEIIGGQVIYPVSDDDWRLSAEKRRTVEQAIARVTAAGHEAYLSIRLGGYAVIGASKAGCAALLKELPPIENYPFQLINHAAFHTPLLRATSARAFDVLPSSIFRVPEFPLIDGRGCIWHPYSTDVAALYDYTFGHQVTDVFDFTRAITVALKEFAPDHLVLLGPGSSLGGSIGQVMIENDWLGLKNKAQFSKRQATEPVLLAMGRPEQRPLVVGHAG